jgi:DinB family protein
MSSDRSLREHVLSLLKGDNAHADFETAIKDMPPDLQGKRPEGSAHSPWEILEHMRIAQRDILEFTRNPEHVSPDFPGGYWPSASQPPNEKAWNRATDAFRSDLAAISALVADDKNDLFAPLPHGDGQTLLREALLIADHNAYHLGELILLRRLLGAWR